MSKRASKLSRAKPSKIKSSQLNNSDEDFQNVTDNVSNFTSILEKPQSTQIENEGENSSVLQTTTSSSSVAFLQPCPFCGKTFSQELTRISHLKACGTQLGVGTNQLLEIKKLEDRQAEEWKALNLPKTTNTSKNNTTSKKNSTLKVNKTEFRVANDPHLEMALALSASMANEIHENTEKGEDKKCWLPQPPTEPLPTTRRNFKSKAKTALQVRTDEERSKQITEAVVAVLSCDFGSGAHDNYEMIQTQLVGTCQSCRLWRASSLTESSINFYIEFFKPYISEIPKVRKVLEQPMDQQRTEVKEEPKVNDDISKHWLKLLESGEKADLTIYTRNEEVLKAHSLVIYARCKNLLDEVIEENENKQILSVPEVSKNVMKSFLKFLYTGQVHLIIDNEQDLQDAQYLAKRFPKLEHWSRSINDHGLRGFIDEEDDEEDHLEHQTEEEARIASQNLSNLLKVLDDDDDDVDDDDEEEKEEWDEMCQILSQKSQTERPDSPDLFDDEDDEDGMNVDHQEVNKSKRKSSVDFGDINETKKSKMEEDESFAYLQNCSTYSRVNTSPPSILQDIEMEEELKETEVSLNMNPGNDEKNKSSMHQDDMCDNVSEMNASVGKNDSLSSTPSFLKSPPQLEDKDESLKISPLVKKCIFSSPNGRDEVSEKSESPQNGTFHTPSFLNSPALKEIIEENVTPMPDYESMLTPALRQELRRFGLKVIPRRKAVPLLQHIYEETHPEVRRKVDFGANNEAEEEEQEMSLSQESNESEDLPEESILELDDAKVSQDEDLHAKLMKFIRDDPALHRQALLYEPLWLEDLFLRFKESVGVPIKINQVQEMLDVECITFRTRARHDKNVKRNAKAKKSRNIPSGDL